MGIFHYVAFHRDTYKTSVAYARNLMVLDKESIVSAAAQIGLKLSKSHTKERLANELSEYVRMHANVALAYVNDEQMLLLNELVDAGPDTIVWKRHLRKYDFLKRMVWVVVNYDRQGKKDDLYYWINDDWFGFESPMQKEIVSAYQGALKKGNGTAIALALSPFAVKTAELVNGGAYEEAAGCCYTIFRCLAKACKKHEDWFSGFTGYGDTYTKLAIFTEAIAELYCHLRQKLDLSKRMADEMNINLEVFNLETNFFGDLHCSSRFTDMLCDAQAQYGDYSELDECPMWGMWLKEGGE